MAGPAGYGTNVVCTRAPRRRIWADAGGYHRVVTTRMPSLGPRGEGWVVIQGVMFAAIFLGGIVVPPAWGGPTGTEGAAGLAGVVLGIWLIAAGAVLAVAGILALRVGGALTALPRPRAGSRLVAHGPYRLVRHPIYGGLVLGAVGWGLVRASPLALFASAALLLFFRLKSGREEAWLHDHFPDYAGYRARTRRLIPWVY